MAGGQPPLSGVSDQSSSQLLRFSPRRRGTAPAFHFQNILLILIDSFAKRHKMPSPLLCRMRTHPEMRGFHAENQINRKAEHKNEAGKASPQPLESPSAGRATRHDRFSRSDVRGHPHRSADREAAGGLQK